MFHVTAGKDSFFIDSVHMHAERAEKNHVKHGFDQPIVLTAFARRDF